MLKSIQQETNIHFYQPEQLGPTHKMINKKDLLLTNPITQFDIPRCHLSLVAANN